MATDPLFPPLSTTFRGAVIDAIILQLDRSAAIPKGLDRRGATFVQTVENMAFMVLLQLEEGRGFEEGGARYHSHLVFTPKGESPGDTCRLIFQDGRTMLHGGLTKEEVEDAIARYLA